MRRCAGYLAGLCCIAAAVWLCICGLVGFRTVEARSGGILLAAADETERLGADEIQAIREWEAAQEEPVDFTAWRETEETVTALDGCKRTQTTVVRLFGSSEPLLPYGKILQDWDDEGCLLGEKTAETLFGSHEAAGLTVSCDGREYVVRGVLSSPGELLVIVDNTEAAVCDYITLGYRGSNKKGVAESFLSRYGLSMQLMERTGFTGTFAVTELLPGSWSDFAGWKSNFAAWQEDGKRQKQIARSVFEVSAEDKMHTAAGTLGAGILLFFTGIWQLEWMRRRR